MSWTRGRAAFAVVAAAGAIFVMAGGPATAGKLITKNQIAPNAVTTKAIANGAVTEAKLSKSLRKSLKGKAGANGANGTPGAAGALGAKGDTGARGPAGAFNVVDATGKVLGLMVPPINAPMTAFMTPEGAILQYDPNPASPNYPVNPSAGPIFYQSAVCEGPGYAMAPGPEPFQKGIVLAGPPVAGSDVYVLTPGTPQSFTSVSRRDGAGCTASATGVSNAFVVKAAGKVPTVTKPLLYAPAG